MEMNKKVGFIGAGNMAYAIAKALVSSGVVKAKNIIASARTTTRLDTCWKVKPIHSFIYPILYPTIHATLFNHSIVS